MFSKLIEIGCVQKDKQILLKSGQISTIYVDLRILTQYPKLLHELCFAMYEKAKNLFQEDTCLIGVPLGGIHLATILSQLSYLPQVLVRKKSKHHGSQKIIENSLHFKNVILVEDVLTTGSSVKELIEILSMNSNFKVCGIVCILNRSHLTHIETKNNHIPIFSVFNQFSLL